MQPARLRRRPPMSSHSKSARAPHRPQSRTWTMASTVMTVAGYHGIPAGCSGAVRGEQSAPGPGGLVMRRICSSTLPSWGQASLRSRIARARARCSEL